MQGATTVEWMFCTATNVARCKGKARSAVPRSQMQRPPTGEDKTVLCEIYKQAFKTQRNLSTNVLYILWNVMRNKRRLRQTDQVGSRRKGAAKCGGKKSWTLIRLEKSLEGHPHIAMQMMEHLPDKSLKQIKDKRREPTFKALVEQYKATQGDSATPELQDIRYPSSDSETESRPVPTGLYISETEDEGTSDQGHITRQLSPSFSRTGQTSLAQ